MIHSLKMVNWRSHGETAINFSPATNLLIGSIGSGKTSCLDAICFALFGTFPALRARKVSLEDTLTVGAGKDRGLVELVFTAGEQKYTVTRAFSPKGTEAFLRTENGRLLEGPQPIRTTEAVSRLLKLDYDLFSRIVYGEQNKLDYFLTLGKGERKIQLDEALGIAAFETARANSSTVVSRLRSEKSAMDQFLAGVEFEAIEMEVTALHKSVAQLAEKEQMLSVQRREFGEEMAFLKKNIEGLESVKKIYEELASQLVRADAEAQSLSTSASAIMPVDFSSVSQAECTSFLEQCARALQERAGIEQEVNKLSLEVQALKGEIGAVQKSISTASLQKLNYELPQLEAAAMELEQTKLEFLEAAKASEASQRSLSMLEAELREIFTALAKFSTKIQQLSALQVKFSSLDNLEAIVAEQRQRRLDLEKLLSAKLDAIDKMEKTVALLSSARDAGTGGQAMCPTCEQPLAREAAERLFHTRRELLAAEAKLSGQIEQDLEASKAELAHVEQNLAKWVELLPLESQTAELRKREETLSQKLSATKLELAAASAILRSCQVKISSLQAKAERLEQARAQKAQVERDQAMLAVLGEELAKLQGELERKALALSSFEKRDELESKLSRARDALKAYDMLERRAAALAKGSELSAKLSAISFDPSAISDYNYKLNVCSTQLEGCTVSLQHTSRNMTEKKELLAKLETQLAKLSEIRAGLQLVASGIQNVQVFQNCLVETQAILRSELISAVNETMAELWPTIYPYRDYRSARLVPTEDDYLLQLLDAGGNWKAVERASGGEKTCASLCLRVALAMVLVPNLNWLVLDEPTHNLDSQAVSLLARALHDTLPAIVKQTFVVTHDDALKEGASGSVHIFHRDKDRGAFTVVETL